MNIYSRKCEYSIIILVVLFAVAPVTSLQAQIKINGTPVGPTYLITTDGLAPIEFFQDEGVVTVRLASSVIGDNLNHYVTWGGNVNINKDLSGTFDIIRRGNGDMDFTLTGALTGSGDLIKTGNGTFILNGDSRNFVGGVIIKGGTFALGTNPLANLSKNAVIIESGTFDISDAGNPVTIASLAGSGKVQFAAGNQTLTVGDKNDTTFNGTLAGNANSILEKVGSGTLYINSNVSSFAGTIRVNEGTLGGTGRLREVIVVDGGTLAPGSGADSVEKIWIDNLTLSSGSILKIRSDADGNTDQIFTTNTTIDHGAKLFIDALAGDYVTPKYYNGYIIGGAPNFGNFDVNIETAQKFLDVQWKVPGDQSQGYTIGRKPNYFNNPILTPTHNLKEVGKALDKAGGSLWDVMTRLSDEMGSGAPRHDLIRDAYNQIAGDLRANSMMLGQWQTSRYGLNHLDLTNCGYSQGGGVWLEIIHQTTDFKSDGNSGPYGISRTGFLVGSEERRVDTVFGFFVGYSYPYLYNHGNKVEAGDLQFGFYGGSKVAEVLETKLFVGYGHQGYKSRRYITNELLIPDNPGPDWDSRINGKYSGDSMSMSLELAVPWSSGMFCLRPVVAIDSDLTWQYGFAETGNTGLELWYDRNFMDRSFLRTGLTAQLGSVDRCDTLALQGRAYYGHQVFGDPYPVSRSRFLGEDHRMTIHGVNPGRDYVDLGVGLRWNIDAHRSFYGDYDFNAFSRSNAHWGTFGFMQRW